MERGVPVRSISRSIAVLQCVNRNESVTLMEISRLAKVPYPTASRIVQTLIHEGLVEFEVTRKRYHPTCKVESLATGYREDGRLIEAARAPLAALTRDIGWPVTLSSAVGTTIVVRACTHEMSALTFSHYYRGDNFPLLECAPGHVHLAFSDEATREGLLQVLAREHRHSVTLEMFRSGRLMRRIVDDGHAAIDRTQHTKDPGKTSTLSLPVQLPAAAGGAPGQGKLMHLSVNFFASAMTLREGVQRYLAPARQTADAILADWKALQAQQPASGTDDSAAATARQAANSPRPSAGCAAAPIAVAA